MKNKVFLTFDIDWAPDQMVNQLIDLCLENDIKATFFATHNSETLENLAKLSDNFEIGLHPNFMSGSTQGDSPEQILDFCTALVPDAISIRTHCVYQHGHLYADINKYFGNRIVESSICMPGLYNIQPFELYTPFGCLIRVPFFWADDYYLLGKQLLDPNKLLEADGCKVYMFHPVHIFYNTVSMEHYEALKTGNKIQHPGVTGIRDIFNELLQHVTSKDIDTGLMKEFLLMQK